MKAIIAVLLALFVVSAHAEIRIENGKVMTVNLVDSGVKVTPEAAKYPDAVAEVFRDRTKVSMILAEKKARLVGLFHGEEQSAGMVYDSTSNTIGITTDPKILAPESFFFWFPVLWILGVLAGIALNVSRREKTQYFALASFVVVGVSIVSGLGSVVAVFGHDSVIASVITALCVVVSVTGGFIVLSKRESSFVSNLVYHTAMVIGIIVVYYPLFF